MNKLNALVVAGSLVALAACDRNDRTATETKTEQKAENVENKTENKLDELADKTEKKADQAEQKIDEKTAEAKNELAPKGTGGGPAVTGTREWARDQMAKVHCDHYQSCGDIANGKKYDTMDSCITRVRASLDKDWELDDCPKIDQPRLDACIAAVKAKKCDALFDKTPSECDDSKVCIKP